MEYGQFCPIAKALEIVGEKWTVLIIRELLMGGSRFNELQRGLCLISPTILNKRLATLAEHGLVLKKKLPGQQGYAYYATESCKQLLPVIKSLGDWGMRWARDGLTDRDCHPRRPGQRMDAPVAPDGPPAVGQPLAATARRGNSAGSNRPSVLITTCIRAGRAT